MNDDIKFSEYIKEKLENIENELKKQNGKLTEIYNWYISYKEMPDTNKTEIDLLRTNFLAHYNETNKRYFKGEITAFKVKVLWGFVGIIGSLFLTFIFSKL